MNEQFFHPPIIRERKSNPADPQSSDAPKISEELDGDCYFEPPIVRELSSKTDEQLAASFIESQKNGSAVMTDLIQALNNIS